MGCQLNVCGRRERKFATFGSIVCSVLALTACTPVAPTPSSSSGPSQTADASPTITPSSAVSSTPTTDGSVRWSGSFIPTDQPSPSALAPGVSLAPGSVLGIRYSGSTGTLYEGRLTVVFDDGAVVPRDASGTIPTGGPITQPLGADIVAVRVTGTVQSADGTYRVEIVGGRLEGLTYVPDQLLAVDEATGGGDTVQVDYGNVDL